MNLIKYAFDTDGVGEVNHTFRPAICNVLSVHIRSEKDQVLMEIEVKGVFDGDDLTAFNDFFENWAVAFGFEFSVPIRELRNCGHSLPTRKGARNTQINASDFHCPSQKTLMMPSDERLDNVFEISLEATSEQSIYRRLFAFANSESDSISRYLFLYNLLLQMSDDKQRQVDSLIIKIMPDCERSTSPKNGKLETIYTRLRNELSHKRKGASYSKTKLEIIMKVDGFSNVVRESIMTKINENS